MASDMATRLVAALLRQKKDIYPILGFPLTSNNARQLNLSVSNPELKTYVNHEDYTQTLDRESFVW